MNYLFMSSLATQKVFSNNYGTTALAVFEIQITRRISNHQLRCVLTTRLKKEEISFPNPEKI